MSLEDAFPSKYQMLRRSCDCLLIGCITFMIFCFVFYHSRIRICQRAHRLVEEMNKELFEFQLETSLILQVTTTGVLACLRLDRAWADRTLNCYNGMYACRCLNQTTACHTAAYKRLQQQCFHTASLTDAAFCASPSVFRTAGGLDLQQLLAEERALDPAFDFENDLPIQAVFTPLAMDFHVSSSVCALVKKADVCQGMGPSSVAFLCRLRYRYGTNTRIPRLPVS